jgi:peptidoglycan DL-endopeptidase LytF
LKLQPGSLRRHVIALIAMAILLPGLISRPSSSYASDGIKVGGMVEVVDTDGDVIRIRAGAGTEFDQVGESAEGQRLNVLAGPSRDKKGNRWFKVRGDGGTGWIVAGFLRGIDTASVPSERGSSQPNTDRKPSRSNLTGFARVANTDGDPLRVRSVPGADGKVLATLAPDTSVAVKAGPVTDESGVVWYQISSNSVTGWAMARYFVQAQAPSQPEPAKKTVVEQKPKVEAKRAVEQESATKASPIVKVTSEKAEKVAEVEVKPIASSRAVGQRIVDIGMQYVGYRYAWGGTTPKGFDCTGFLYYVYNKAGVRMPRDMGAQLGSGPRVSTKELQPGDLLFWSNTYKRGLSHAGIYIGNGKFVHAENESTGVVVSSMNTAYWASRFTAAVRPR